MMFHASPNVFTRPDYELCLQNHGEESHDNSNLGLWYGTSPDWIRRFGGHVYAFELEESAKALDLQISELSKWSREISKGGYQEKRNFLLDSGYSYIRVVEIDGISRMGIILDFDKIKNFRMLYGIP